MNPMEKVYRNSGGVGECRRWQTAHAGFMTILGNEVPRGKKKMSDPPRAVVDERTTTIVEYIGFRPSWRLNVELILCWDVCFQVLGKMTDKCYGADERPARLRPSAA